jgi:DNA modification methylase
MFIDGFKRMSDVKEESVEWLWEDPCAGSFTTALACRELRRRFIGCDVHNNCVVAGQRRLAEESK